MKLHHYGCLVKDIESAKKSYLNLFENSKASETFNITTQNVKVCFIDLPETNTFLELVQPTNADMPLNSFLKKGINFYHMGFLVDNVDDKILELQKMSYKTVTVFNSEAFENKKCAFLYSPLLHLIELIEA